MQHQMSKKRNIPDRDPTKELTELRGCLRPPLAALPVSLNMQKMCISLAPGSTGQL